MEDLEIFLKRFEDLLIDLATYNENESNDYIIYRKKLLSYDYLKDFIPDFIIKNRKPQFFRAYMQEIGGYKERRDLIYKGFERLYDYETIKNFDSDNSYNVNQIENFLERFEDLLIDLATENLKKDGFEEYSLFRKKFLTCNYFKDMPIFLKRNPKHFRYYMQSQGGYKERRKIISEEFNKLFSIIEGSNFNSDSNNKNKSINKKEYDIFVSHSSEDKEDFVKEFVNLLKQKGLSVWYDDDIVKIGHNLRKRISKGIKSSNYAVVIFSEDFFKSKWTNYEYDNIFLDFYDEEKVLPILHDLTIEDLEKFDGSIPLIRALSTKKFTVEEIIHEILERINEEKS
ncbi:TIR domain-containing protein [Methanobrevibacter olleyae]|uniref:Probable 2' cyclic ADP-D-ribose synthase TcpO n=1 Tax=Methanobrevibacter olleyae TaxID=294671 RepID=TCPO_METOL|nr:NAD(+) hydrolase TcpO [Methanobrevibacter olleyae]A0A1I4KS07.1 RecName: Full=Probable 2' cyclic ADP-D-ribose synthase TcpO; Short=2'cADPR synthase TcpO; AltName: Full=NAD(+) hydrolase TcpO; AltName: Full=TIR domain-containing protein in M.olleyae; Short=tcpO [Methanobrevibacter olleyae]SFL81530.1 TIR domain-containing protein [Methanobrevibacter olleyae]